MSLGLPTVHALYAKFMQDECLMKLLLDTGDRNLVEYTSRDSYWGDSGDGSGLNKLGKLLIRLRDELRKEIEAMAGTVPQRDRKWRTMGVGHQCRHPCTVLADGLQCERCTAGSRVCKREGCSSPRFFDPELGSSSTAVHSAGTRTTCMTCL